ncbi:MAG TPA: hypothetical protein VOA80_25265, partial [Thermoanaerobaculia bacterium]|nr:hypothetical protein [Thermoanaerobaculia bacterium]
LVDGNADRTGGTDGSHATDGDRREPGDAADFGGKAVFFADLVPTVAHVSYPWIMSYDLFPMTTLENKKIWLPRAAAEGWLAMFQHELEAPLGRVVEEKPGRFRAVPLAATAALPAGAAAVAAAPVATPAR